MEEVHEEVDALHSEFEWILKEEVNSVLQELNSILLEACKRFPLHIHQSADNCVRPEKYVLSNTSGASVIKCMVTLLADNICEADLTLKIHKHQNTPIQCKLYPDVPWHLQQIQDAGNHLLIAFELTETRDPDYNFTSGQEVLKLIDSLTDALSRARSALALPKKKKLEELVKNPQLVGFKPQLPGDVVVSFYVQAQKLVLAIYQLFVNTRGKVDIAARYQLETQVPWLNEVIVLCTLALQQCQQLRHKLSVFIQYEAETKFLKGHSVMQPHPPPPKKKHNIQKQNLIDFDSPTSVVCGGDMKGLGAGESGWLQESVYLHNSCHVCNLSKTKTYQLFM
ncbi:hypothetical protein CAPTEDRAFT_221341 [Capitella teleta]|uniref:Protein rogdi n=1 Tax=Capitella teleta TaxID=283909 RepID=R7UMJ5_CAPTE|nr:hypothetical protein CAPTEDRAFT_221341 [Capitella teleta]|eukprot:ELU07759.1 hypothetical protein CAPTEDRAFT_221341 [Capitella teleta]